MCISLLSINESRRTQCEGENTRILPVGKHFPERGVRIIEPYWLFRAAVVSAGAIEASGSIGNTHA